MSTAENLRKIVDELSLEFYERSEHIQALVIGDLAGEHTFLLGPPGTAKSQLVRATCARIQGARYWETLLDRQLPLESLFGPWDITEFEKNGNWHRRVDGYLPTAHKVFLDEVGKAGPAVLNPLLTALNERKYHNGGVPMDIPLISAVGASNEELEAELGAFRDRFMITMVVEPIVEPRNFAALLDSTTKKPTTTKPTTVTLEALIKAREEEVPAVRLPTGIVDSLVQLRAELRAEQITPSDRRWKKSMRLLQATAYLNGRDAVDDEDLAILQHVLWEVPEQMTKVLDKVGRLTGPIATAVADFTRQLDDITARIQALKGQPGKARAEYGGEAQHKLNQITKALHEQTEKANRQGRNTSKLTSVRGRVNSAREMVLVECMNLPPEDAARAVRKDEG